VIQGSAIGPASFIVTESDLQPVHNGNALVKFADDTYVIVPADNSDTSTSELMNVKSWSEDNNLKAGDIDPVTVKIANWLLIRNRNYSHSAIVPAIFGRWQH